MNTCCISACPMKVPNEPRSGFWKSKWDELHICHTHWFMLPHALREKLSHGPPSTALAQAWHVDQQENSRETADERS